MFSGLDSKTIPTIPTDITDITSLFPGLPSNIACSQSDFDAIKKYSKLIPKQIAEINRLMNLPTECTLINMPELFDFMDKNPNYKVPTQESINSDVSKISSCSDVKEYLQKNSDQLATLLRIITESKTCKEESAIDYQTQSIKNKIPDLDSKTNTYSEKTKYQTDMYNSVKYINEILLILYVVLFSVIHILFLVQYLQGVKRDAISDTIWITVFFFYPYLIYYIEKTIYSGIMYTLSLIYGTTYVYQFDKLLLFTDFYRDPGANNPQGVSSL